MEDGTRMGTSMRTSHGSLVTGIHFYYAVSDVRKNFISIHALLSMQYSSLIFFTQLR